MLGICFGHQLLSWTFDAKVGSLAQPVLNRFEQVRLADADELFAGFKEGETVLLAENHYDYVLKESLSQSGLILLADSPRARLRRFVIRAGPVMAFSFILSG